MVTEREGTEAAWRLHRGERGEGALLAVERQLGPDVDVGDAVAVGEAEGLVEVVGHPLDPSTGQRALTGVDERDPPRLGGVLVHLDGVVLDVDRDVGLAQRGS